MVLRVLSGPLANFHDLAAGDATTALIINVITAVGQFQRDLQNELTAEGIAAAETQGRYRGRPPALTGDRLKEVRSAFRDQGISIAALPCAHGVSRVAIRAALANLLPAPRIQFDPELHNPSRGLRRRVVQNQIEHRLAAMTGLVAQIARELLERCRQLTVRINELERQLTKLM